MIAAGLRKARTAGALALASAALAAPALATEVVRYAGETEDGRKVKLVADSRGEVLRGAITTETVCTNGFDPFRARVEFRSPLDRSGPRGFRDKGSFLEEDDRFSGRYRYKVEAEREGERAFAGELDLEIVFRRSGEEYTRCVAESVAFGAKRVEAD